MIFDFFRKQHTCTHKNVPVDVDECYCPDCGELIKNEWFIVRCACCNIKRQAHLEYDELKPDTKFCQNCGADDFTIEKIDSLNCVNSRYAVIKQRIIKQEFSSVRQIWVEDDYKKQTFDKIPRLEMLNQHP